MKSKSLFLREELAGIWQESNIYEALARLEGDVFRNKEGRKTMRFFIKGKSYFLKLHTGVGWWEIFKNLLSFRLPIISAKNEWQAIKFLKRHGIETMSLAAYGEKGFNPAKKHSFVITEDLVDTMSLEHLGAQWRENPPSFTTKKSLIEKLAKITSTMHQEGMNHRDFYLCHFLLDKGFEQTNRFTVDTPLYLIDLHRAQLRHKTPKRWVIKDLGSLYFSAYAVPLTNRDCLRFIRTYTQQPLKQVLKKDLKFWTLVKNRADALYAKC